MATVKVYRYDYYDGLLKHDRRSVDYATADTIATLRGTILAESVREVDERLVSGEGVLRAADLWKTEMPPRAMRGGAAPHAARP